MSTTSTPEKFTFEAEVKQVLDIVVNSLYTDKEIFVRELVSNASDALEKLRHTQLTEKEIFDEKLPLEINISTDDKAGTITIQDYGIGMTREELVENLGTIAHSGSKSFLNQLKEKGENNENLIGKFGVGFYSAFMVAESVQVFTHSWKKDTAGSLWESDGLGSYTIEDAEGQRRGTKIVIKLKDEYKEFSEKATIERILKQYSAFVQFPITLDGDKINTIGALWMQSKSDITDEQYIEFYKFQANAWDEPIHWLHFSADAPLEINSLLFVPKENMERFGMGHMDPQVALYCRKVLIDPSPKNLLPDWLRFLRGVVDSSDLPLNISRETMQDSQLVQKLSRVLTKRFVKDLETLAKKTPEKFEEFWKTFGIFIKEGITTDYDNREALLPLLRFESSTLEKGTLTSLPDYVSRMKEEQKEIFYLSGQSRQALEASPYLEAFTQRGIEVLFLYENADEFVMQHAREFKEKKIISADQEDVELGESEAPAGEALSKEDTEKLSTWIKDTLGEKVTKVESNDRLISSPAMILNADKMMTAQMRRIMKQMGQDAPNLGGFAFAINPRNAIIKNVFALREKNQELASEIIHQLYDNACLAAGQLEDPKDLVQRTYSILEKISK